MPTRPPECPRCHFPKREGRYGFVRSRMMVLDPDSGELKTALLPCPVCSADAERAASWERYRALVSDANLPRAAASWSFRSFPREGKEEAAAAVERYSEQGEGGPFVNLLLTGPFGVGKTSLAICVLHARLDRKEAGLFWTLPDLFTRIKGTYHNPDDTESEQSLLEKMGSVPLLVLDDLGVEKPSEWQREKLYQVLNRRMNEDRATVFTSNLTERAIAERVGGRLAERIFSRCLVVPVGGTNLRRAV